MSYTLTHDNAPQKMCFQWVQGISNYYRGSVGDLWAKQDITSWWYQGTTLSFSSADTTNKYIFSKKKKKKDKYPTTLNYEN